MIPFFSIIIPFKSRIDLLLETIKSFQTQTFQNWELILVDDGTSLFEVQQIEGWISNDVRVKHLRRMDGMQGASVCRNLGLKMAKGKWVIFFDSDDLITSDCLNFRMKECEKHDDLDMLVFQTAIFQNTPSDATRFWNRFYDQDDLLRFLNADVVWPICGSLIRREYILKNNLQFNEQALSFQDWEWHIRVLCKFPHYIKVSSPVNMFIRRNNSYIKNSDSHHQYEVTMNRLQNMKLLCLEAPIQSNYIYIEAIQRTMLFEIFRLQNNRKQHLEKFIIEIESMYSSSTINKIALYLKRRSKLLAIHPVLFKIYTRLSRKTYAQKALIMKRSYNSLIMH
ncbi:MAG: glycosyltransferase family 2 protein, partial [Ferruginibacter sp.]|nr:glycosyltransferase family 2 protein [Ferruginibacter sp.]